jgi:[glutamine synthetase] adenylyltransferase / [glutamine synthetase]-adenylyl-L-tyrosine phosphorylase
VLSLHEEIQFRDPVRARPELIYLGKFSSAAARSVSALLPSLPNPDDAVHFLNRLTAQAPDAARRITDDPRALRYALTVFSFSHFLADSIIRFPEWIVEIADARDLHRGFLAEQYEDLLVRSLPANGIPRPVDLALFRRKQLLRILLRDVLQFADLSETTEDLSNLADAILNATWQATRRELAQERGIPPGAEFSVIALGKLGGRELNYSSDIDLMFVYSGDARSGNPGGPGEFFRVAATRITDMLSTYTQEGMCYRVDLRLRPDGRFGEVCHSLEGAKEYYASRGRDWELQMLIKARIAAGDPRPGRELLEFVEPLIYRTTTDFRTIEAVSETRARIHEKIRLEKQRQTKPSGADVKLAKGGIRDIEFLVQCLQRLHGGREPWVRHGGTLLALSRLRDKDLLSPLEYARLASAYQFMRDLEHRLQFDEDRQIHTLPEAKDQLDLLARKMPFSGLPSAGTLERQLDHHFSSVQDLYERVIHSQLSAGVPVADAVLTPAVVSAPDVVSTREADPIRKSVPIPESLPAPEIAGPARVDFPSANLRRYLDQRAPVFAQLLADSGISRGIALADQSFESFLEKAVANPVWLDMLESNVDLARCTIDLFEHSQYFADQLVRHPELIEEVCAACGERQGRTGFHAPRDPDGLRRFFRSQMVRIQSDSVYHRVSVFRTLKRTSELAESVVQAAYEIAIAGAVAANAAPSSLEYAPSNQMMVIALGRLGMLEFDLASDADLVFVIPDSDSHETLFWTGVAERMISVISAYTGDGVVFTIDTRLRPNGREGALVQTEASYKDYFANHAEAWEGISYMKARAVAGNIERATAFLGELQEIDWRRYGQSGRSRAELAQMRGRLEREQGTRNPLKAAAGGYYDIDFALMFLRLKSAGFFFKVLNTPERIDTVEKMGHLDREDAAFLRDAVTFYRAVDHGLRVSTGHAEGRLPTNRAHLAILADLVHRWTPPSLHEGTLNSVSKRIRQDTRVFFEGLFGKYS